MAYCDALQRLPICASSGTLEFKVLCHLSTSAPLLWPLSPLYLWPYILTNLPIVCLLLSDRHLAISCCLTATASLGSPWLSPGRSFGHGCISSIVVPLGDLPNVLLLQKGEEELQSR